MAYTKQTWADLPSKTTPINATRLGHIEDGIFNAAQTADTAASTAGTAAANVGIVSGKVETLTERVNGLDTAVSNKVDKVAGKGLSENDFTNTLKSKLDGIASGAEVNVQSDWNEADSSSDAFILNKPTLGTASTKNSTSVVTESTDLVESGAVYNALGFGNKNLFNPELIKGVDTTLVYTPYNIGDGTFTCSSNMPLNTGGGANLFILAGNVQTGASTSENGVYVNNPRTVTSVSGYITIVSRVENIDPRNYNNQLEKGSTATAYEPYHESVEDTLRDAEVVEGKNLLPITVVSQTINNVAFTVNDDGTISTANTSNADWATFVLSRFTLSKGSYILSGCIGGSQATYRLVVGKQGGDLAIVYDGESSFELSEDAEIYVQITVRYANVNMNGKKFYPMIRKATETDPTYEPYYVPLKDVVPTKADNSVIGTVEDGATASKAWSVGEHFIRGGKFCTVTVPVTTSSTWTEGSNYTSGDVAEMLAPPELLPNNANLNNYSAEGEYFAGAGNYSNCPISDTAFRFKVMPFNAEASRCIQIIYANKTEPEIYMRTNFGGTWQPWYKFTGTVVS